MQYWVQADLTTATAVTINQLRQAVQVQKLYERGLTMARVTFRVKHPTTGKLVTWRKAAAARKKKS